MVEKIPMEGVNISPKMTRVSLSHSSLGGGLISDFLHPLAQERINMNLFIAGEGRKGCQVLCCVAEADGSRTVRLAHPTSGQAEGTVVHEPVGLISIFPLHSSLKTVGLALIALAGARVPVYGFCSSLSALTFVIDHDRLDEAISAFEGCFGFPGERPADR
jgi:aspartokinase